MQALELQPGDKNALVSRSRCHLLLGNAKSALQDTEEALAADQHCAKGWPHLHSALVFLCN